MRFKMDFSKLARCGAKARSNNKLPCRHVALSNGRCHYHGGKSIIKHGKYTTAFRIQKAEQQRTLKDAKIILQTIKKIICH